MATYSIQLKRVKIKLEILDQNLPNWGKFYFFKD